MFHMFCDVSSKIIFVQKTTTYSEEIWVQKHAWLNHAYEIIFPLPLCRYHLFIYTTLSLLFSFSVLFFSLFLSFSFLFLHSSFRLSFISLVNPFFLLFHFHCHFITPCKPLYRSPANVDTFTLSSLSNRLHAEGFKNAQPHAPPVIISQFRTKWHVTSKTK